MCAIVFALAARVNPMPAGLGAEFPPPAMVAVCFAIKRYSAPLSRFANCPAEPYASACKPST